MSKRLKMSDESVESSSEQVMRRSKIGRRFCQHCNESLSLKTYLVHRRLYYNQVVFFNNEIKKVHSYWYCHVGH